MTNFKANTSGSRRKSREIVLQMLYQADLGKQTPAQVEKTFWTSREEVDEATRAFSSDLFRVATTRAETIDSLIVSHARNWRLERMPAVDRNLLRMAIAEMLGYPRTPGPIVINEALEIAKRYAAPESMQFLNGVLDAVGQSLKVPAVLGARTKKLAPEAL
jgi:N utilization substance protein B